jgi:hypothetical protein
MNAEILTCDPPVDLSGKALKFECKVALVKLTHDKINSYGTIEDKYNLKYYTLRKYFRKVRNGLPMFETSGRPPRLDEQSVEILRTIITMNRITEKAQIYKNIREQNKETMKRRYPNGIPAHVKQNLPMSTVRLYATTLLAMV